MQRSVFVIALCLSLVGCATPEEVETVSGTELPKKECLEESLKLEEICTEANSINLPISELERCAIYTSSPEGYESNCGIMTLTYRALFSAAKDYDNHFLKQLLQDCESKLIGQMTIAELKICHRSIDDTSEMMSFLLGETDIDAE